MSTLTPRSATTSDGRAVVYHQVINQLYWVVCDHVDGEVLRRANDELECVEWIREQGRVL